MSTSITAKESFAIQAILNGGSLDCATVLRVLRDVDAALSPEVEKKTGYRPNDPLYFFDVVSDVETKCAAGEREIMRDALVRDNRINKGDEHHVMLAARAPSGMCWCVIDWGAEVTTMLRPMASEHKWTTAKKS